MAGFYDALRAELAAAWFCTTAPLKRLFESVVRDGIPPPTSVQGLPPGQFPPIDAIKDELFGLNLRPRGAPLEGDAVPGVRIRSRGERGAS
jgi:hypothetical protein